MCGLFGYLLADPARDRLNLEGRLLAAQAALHHRGPDDRGLESFSISQGNDLRPNLLSLGHTRLSIIDLTPGGHQPMHSGDGRFTVVFNGEIYNYRELRQELKALGYSFHTDSDTEVLLAAWAHWGIEGLRRLTGMFAFAVYDRQDECLTLVRDAFGIKPLFYQHDASGFRFASEIPALLCLLGDEPELNYQSAYDYLVFGSYDNSADSFYQGIHHLLPGHWLRVDLRSCRAGEAHRWWWPSIEERTDLSFEDAAVQLREMFLNNVRLHLRSDVPVGAALSGGVDSSSVVCAMRHLEPDMPIHTFSYVARGSSVDEEKWVDIVNAHVGAIAHKVVVEPHELAKDLDDMIRAQGEPFGGTSIYAQYRVFKAAREAGIVVTLDGQGADEMLGGYEGYPYSVSKSIIEKHGYIQGIAYLNAWRKSPGRTKKQACLCLARHILPDIAKYSLQKIKRRSNKYLQLLDSKQISNNDIRKCRQTVNKKDGVRGRRLAQQLRSDLTSMRISRLLRYADRNAMTHSIETRVPFLTVELAEFMLTLPEQYLVSHNGESKYIFRKAMRGLVPDSILDRKDKIGFDTPEQQWIKHLDDSKCLGDQNKAWGILSSEKVKIKLMLSSHDEVSENRMWRLINLIRWGLASGR